MDCVSRRKLHFAGYTLDLARISLSRGDEEILLRPRSFDVLRHLTENSGRLITKDELIEKIWSGTAVTDDSIVQCVKEIRDALGDDQHQIIKTLPRRGYIFAAQVSEISARPSAELKSFPTEGDAGIRSRPKRLTLIAATAARWPALAAAAVASLAAVGVAWWQPWAPIATGQRLSIVVLPFDNLSSDPKQVYLADGITEDLITDLSRIRGAIVIARGTSFSYKG